MKKLLFIAAVLAGCLIYAGNVLAENKNVKGAQMSNVDRVVKFLQDSKVFYIATTDGNQPRVRPFGVALNLDGKVSLCTGSFKNVYKQIIKNPKVEISGMTSDGKWIRLSGELFDNSSDANKKVFWDFMPNLKKHYEGKEKEFSVLSFKNGIATIEDMSGFKEVIELK
jgi:uncharacterized pyridoxamine 5'-phosphate oxidase family protein